MRFKAGDTVISKERETFGKRGVIEHAIHNEYFVVFNDFPLGHNGNHHHGYTSNSVGWWVNEHYLESDKEQKVLEILREWKRNSK